MTTQGITFWWAPKVLLSLGLLLYAVWCWMFAPVSPVLFGTLFIDSPLILAGATIHLWHYWLLRRASHDVGRPRRLVCQQGLFVHIRHPMYLGDIVMGMGAYIACRDVIAAVAFSLLIMVTILLCHDEDRQMHRMFGEEFIAWRRRTRLLIPGIL